MDDSIVTDAAGPPIPAKTPAASPRVVRDVAYGSHPSQTMDVYLPADPQNAAVIFMVHGGAWQFGDKSAQAVVANKLEHWLPRGHILISINYRLSPPDPLEQVGDVAKALAFAQSQAGTWGADAQRFVVVGHSSGAHLVSLLASDPSLSRLHGVEPWLGTVALDSAAFDVTKIMSRRHLGFYDRVFRDKPSYWREASPLHRLNGTPHPMLLVCSKTRPMSCLQAQVFAEKVRGFGGTVQVFPTPLTHKEINARLGIPGYYTGVVDSFLKSLGLP